MNMVMLGAVIEVIKILNDDSIIYGLQQVLPERYHNLIPLNKEAYEVGKKLSESILSKV